MNKPKPRDPLAEGLAWAARITTVALEMFVPGLIGQWLDSKFGTRFLVFVGFVFGFVGGLWHLLSMVKEDTNHRRR